MRLRTGSILLFLILLCAVSLMAYLRPLFQPDVAPYAAAALSLTSKNASQIHTEVFSELPGIFGSQLPQHPTPYWQGLSDSPDYLMQQVPYYMAKPLYVFAAAALAKAGLPIVEALQLISAVSFFLIGLVLLFWTRDPFVSALLILCAEVIQLGRSGTADAVSTLVVVSGLVLVLQKRTAIAAALLLIAVWVRVDNSVLCILLFLWLCYRKRINWPSATALAAIAALSAFLIDHFSGMNTAVLFYRSHQAMADLSTVSHHLSLRQYLDFLALGVRSVFAETEAGVWFLIALLAWRQAERGSDLSQLLVLGAAAWLLHLLLFPFPTDRFAVWFYLLAGMSLAHVLAPRLGFSSAAAATPNSTPR